MIRQIYHVGLTVSDLDRSVAFYRDVLGLQYQGELLMEGKETEAMFRRENCKARVAYLNGSDQLHMPPVELIQFVEDEIHRKPMDLSQLPYQNFASMQRMQMRSIKNWRSRAWSVSPLPRNLIFGRMALAGAKPSTFGIQMESY